LTGDDYLKSLPPGAQNVLKAIAEGRETRSPRQLQDKDGTHAAGGSIHKAYPDFDDKKAAAYGGLVKDFTTGPTSRSLTAYGTGNQSRPLDVRQHGAEILHAGTNEYKRYHQDVTYVATEVARALNRAGLLRRHDQGTGGGVKQHFQPEGGNRERRTYSNREDGRNKNTMAQRTVRPSYHAAYQGAMQSRPGGVRQVADSSLEPAGKTNHPGVLFGRLLWIIPAERSMFDAVGFSNGIGQYCFTS